MNDSVTLDKVEIQISANAGQAKPNLDTLASTLSKLKSAIQGGFNNLSKLAESLEQLKTASTGLEQVSEQLSSLSNIKDALQDLGNISNPVGLGKAIDNLEKLPYVFNNIDSSVLANVARVSKELSEALTPLADKLSQISQGFSAISQLADRYGVSVTKITQNTRQATHSNEALSKSLSMLKNGFKQVKKQNESFFKSLSKNASSIISKVKQIGLSLLGTRTIFTATRKAVSEYMAMDAELTWQITNNWRALGAQLAPAVEYVIYVFKQFVRVIYSIILALTGIDLIARANEKAMAGWGKAAKDTLGNLQKFDDLNVVEFPKGSGDDNQLIELDTIDLSPIQKVIDWVRKLRDEIKEAWNSGQWYGVGEVLAEGLNAAIGGLNFGALDEELTLIAKKFGTFLQGLVDNFDWPTFGTQLTNILSLIPKTITTFLKEIPWSDIGEGLNEALKTFSPAKFADSVLESINTLVKGIGDVISKIDFGVLAKKISELIITTLSRFGEFISLIPWGKLGAAVKDFILNLDWKGIFTGIANIIKSVLEGLGDFFSGLTGLDKKGGYLTMLLLLAGVITILTKSAGSSGEKLTKPLDNISKGLGDFFKTLGKAATIIAILGGIALVIKEISELIKTFSESGASLSDIGILMAEIFGAIALSFVALAAATKLIDTESLLSLLVIFAGLTAVLLVTNEVLKTLITASTSGVDIGKSLLGVVGSLLLLITAFTAAALVLGSNPLALIAILALAASISLVLLTISATLPTILDAIGKFIETIAPVLITILDTIFNGIDKIIYTLNTTLPPVIESIGKLFDSVFGGIANIIKTVGDVIMGIMKTAKDVVVDVLYAIVNFIERLGPAINKFVDNAIAATTKLINFVVSGIEWMVNSIIDAINGLTSGLRKIGNKLFDLIGIDVHIDPISHVYLSRFSPKLETGTNEIPYEGLYHLHPGEAVVPKKYNPALGNGGDMETASRLDRLIEIMENMDFTNIVNIGNETVYKAQRQYNQRQNDKYGSDVLI